MIKQPVKDKPWLADILRDAKEAKMRSDIFFGLTQPTVTPGPVEDYRPWTIDEAREVKKIVYENRICEIYGANTFHMFFGEGSTSSVWTYDYLLASDARKLNGDRCGFRVKKEAASIAPKRHLEEPSNAQQEFEDEINAAFKNLGREERDDLFRRGMEVINNGAKVSEASKLEAAHAAVKIARQEITEQRVLIEDINRKLYDKDAEIMLLRTQVKNMNKDKLLKIHTTCVNEEDNSGESLMITTKVYSNGDDIVKRKDGNIDGIYFYQEITLQSYANSASFNLGSITLTPTILREIANELEQSINSVL